MAIIHAYRNIKRLFKPNLFQAMHPQSMTFMRWLQGHKKGQSPTELVDRYRDWAYICIKKLETAVASVNLNLYVTNPKGKTKAHNIFTTKRLTDRQHVDLFQKELYRISSMKGLAANEEVEQILEHPFIDLWNNVNQFKNGFETIESIIQYLELLGNSYLYVPRGTDGLPIEIWIIPAQGMNIVASKKNFIDGYLYRGSDNIKVPFKPDEIVHFSYPNPKDRWKGMSTLEGILRSIDQNTAMMDYQNALFANRAVPEGFLTVPTEAGIIDSDKQKEIIREWNRLQGGVSNAGKIRMLQGGLEFKELTIRPKDLEYAEGRRLTRDEAAAGFGIPKSLITMDDVNRANSEAGEYQFMRYAIYPRCIRIEQKLNEQLIPLYGDRFFVAFDNPVPADKEFILKKNEVYRKIGVYNANEIRATEGLLPREGGDDYSESVGSSASHLISPLKSPGTIIDSASYSSSRLKDVRGGDKGASSPRPLDMKALYKETHELISFLRTFYKQQMKAVLKKSKPKKDIEVDLQLLDDIDTWIDKARKGVKLPLSALLMKGMTKGATEIGISVSWDIHNADAVKWLGQYTFKFAEKINATVERDLRRLVQRGIKEGWTHVELGKHIRETYSSYDRYKSEMIARTETSRAVQAGKVESWKQSGFVTGKQWVCFPGCCDYCAPMDGKIIELEHHYFNIGDEVSSADPDAKPMVVQYEDIDNAQLHPHCRCQVVAFTEEFTEE